MPQPRNEPVPDDTVDIPKVRPQGAMCTQHTGFSFYDGEGRVDCRGVTTVMSTSSRGLIGSQDPHALTAQAWLPCSYHANWRRDSSSHDMSWLLRRLLLVGHVLGQLHGVPRVLLYQ